MNFWILDLRFWDLFYKIRKILSYNQKSQIRNPDFLSKSLLLSVLFFCSSFSFPQTKSNLEIFYSLAGSSAKEMAAEISSSPGIIRLELNTGTSYSVLNTQIISALNGSGIKLEEDEAVQKIIFVIDNASVEYEEMFRDGFLGDYLVHRNILLEGNYFIQGNDSSIKKFHQSYTDTISVGEIKKIENSSFPFTKGEVPAEPFFSGLFEPLAAIGTAAIAVILFFTIRSK